LRKRKKIIAGTSFMRRVTLPEGFSKLLRDFKELSRNLIFNFLYKKAAK
jgi:hypothetical protein